MKISIIIPFYNVEKYIDRCIKSVKTQTFTDFECILIDDKSTDNTFFKAKKAIGIDSRFRIIQHKENKRQGGARNTGLDNANGEWITFLDSDDLWQPNYLERMHEEAIKSEVDIVVCQMKKINDENQLFNFKQLSITGIYTNQQELVDIFIEHPTTCNKLYKRQIWETLRFPENLFQEDLATCFQTAFYAQRVLFIEDPLYLYYQRQNSTSKHFSIKLMEERMAIFEIMKEVIVKRLNKDVNRLNLIYLMSVVYATHNEIVRYAKKEEKLLLLRQTYHLWNKDFFNPKAISSLWGRVPFHRLFFLWVYYVSPTFSYYIFSLKNKLI